MRMKMIKIITTRMMKTMKRNERKKNYREI